MLTLYHYDRSTAAQRVRLVLEEKALAWKSVIVDTARGDVDELPDDYHRLNPKGLVPVIVNDGAGIAESLVILEYLEDAFPEPSLRPQSPAPPQRRIICDVSSPHSPAPYARIIERDGL